MIGYNITKISICLYYQLHIYLLRNLFAAMYGGVYKRDAAFGDSLQR